MRFVGFVGPDAPDPAAARRAEVLGLGFPVAGLVRQRHLEEQDAPGTATASSEGRVLSASVVRSYLLLRNPDDPDDPANLAELDERTRAELDRVPLRPLPPWLLAARERLRFPMLREAVQTHWAVSPEERRTPAEHLLAHAESILMNRFHEQLGLPWPSTESWGTLVHENALQAAPVEVDGAERSGLLLDTDPFVLGLAVPLDDGRVISVVLPRDDLPFVTLALVSDLPV